MSQKLASVLVVCLFAWSLFAQSEIGGATLNGTVSDPSGSAIPNAKLTATQTSTGFTRVTQTSSAGVYTFSILPAGDYELTVEAQGFKLSKLSKIALSVGAVVTADLKMEIGTAAETVTVAAEAEGIEASRSETATQVNSE